MSNLSLVIHIYPDNDEKSTLAYWSDLTGIPLSQFGKTQVDRRLNKSVRKHRSLPYGTAHLRIRSCGDPHFGVQLHRRILGWIEAAYKHVRA